MHHTSYNDFAQTLEDGFQKYECYSESGTQKIDYIKEMRDVFSKLPLKETKNLVEWYIDYREDHCALNYAYSMEYAWPKEKIMNHVTELTNGYISFDDEPSLGGILNNALKSREKKKSFLLKIEKTYVELDSDYFEYVAESEEEANRVMQLLSDLDHEYKMYREV